MLGGVGGGVVDGRDGKERKSHQLASPHPSLYISANMHAQTYKCMVCPLFLNQQKHT
jgi:hypothetical protein